MPEELLSIEQALVRHREQVLDAIANPDLQGLLWEATLACNLACLHCGNPVEGKEGEAAWSRPQELSTAEAKAIFEQIAEDFDASRIAVGITGGEATLRKDLCEVVAHIKKLGFRAVSLTTNGSLTARDPALLDRLVESGVSLFTLSLDGAKRGHDTQRCKDGSFEDVLTTIRALRERHPHVEVTVNTIVTPHNWHEVPEAYRLVSELGVPTWNVGPVSPVGRARDPSTHLTNEQLRDLLDWIADRNRPANVEASGVRISWICDGWVGSRFEGRVRDGIFFCGAGTRIASILYDGKAATCLEVNRKIGVQGDLRTEPLRKIWDERYGWFRGERASRFRKGPCETCSEWDWCQGSSLHLREEDGTLVECIYHRQSQAAPRDDGIPTAVETATLAPLSMVERDDVWIVGNPDRGTFAEMPPLAVDLLRRLRDEPRVETVRRAVREETGRDVDVGAFVRSVAAGGFVEAINGQPLPSHLVPRKRRTLFDDVDPAKLRWLRSLWLWPLLLAPFAMATGVMLADSSFVPNYRDFFWTSSYTFVGLSVFGVMLLIVGKHELAHVLTARAHGSRASLSLGTRITYIAVQTDASDLWLLPRWDRVKVYVAGMASDAWLAGVAILLSFLGTYGIVPALADPTIVALLRLTALLCVLVLLLQFFLHLRMDVYYIVAHALDCRNLYGDAQAWLKRRLAFAWPRWKSVPEPRVSPREMRVVRAYGLLHFVGVAILLAYFGLLIVPALVVAYGFALGTLADAIGGTQFPTATLLDAFLFVAIHAAYFALLGALHWRDRRRESTGIVARAEADDLTRRLLSHPAPPAMARTVGGKLAQIAPRTNAKLR
ncbi:MAG TPA: radical SAM protein [Candidatus Thermoplasmatota archaeon]|nr:radical SAM protein [Candidatus Thermoplasmatota archaeon]